MTFKGTHEVAIGSAGATKRRGIPIRHAHIRNFLSLKDAEIKLDRLNVLVGPNGGGKSNFLSVFRFLGEVARTDLVPALESLFGGYQQVRYRGASRPKDPIEIHLSGEITEWSSPTATDEYELVFQPAASLRRGTVLRRKEKLVLKRTQGRGRRITLSGPKYEFQDEGRSAGDRRQASKLGEASTSTVDPNTSALSVLRRIGATTDTKQVSELADVFESLRLFDPQVHLARQPAAVAEGPVQLRPDAGNLAGVLDYWNRAFPEIVNAIADDLRDILPGFDRFSFQPIGGGGTAVRVDLVERGLLGPTPLIRASFGTVRAIALLAMLRDPDPPRLTCLEEIDHGLHPHALDIVVERLREASTRSQIILATHSPALVNRLEPSEFIVFERDPDDCSTRIVQKEPEVLQRMKEKSGLGFGELWFSGSLGGVPS